MAAPFLIALSLDVKSSVLSMALRIAVVMNFYNVGKS